jgi:hypothetical protein
VKLLLGGNARTAVLKDILRFSGATAVRKEARGSTSNTGKSDSKHSKKTDTDTNSTTTAAAVTAAVVADDNTEPSDSSPTTDDNKEVIALYYVYCVTCICNLHSETRYMCDCAVCKYRVRYSNNAMFSRSHIIYPRALCDYI